MKKITFFIASFFFTFIMYAQQTLSHSTSQTADIASLACVSDPDQTSGSGDEGVSDTILYRAYTPSDFGFTGDFDAMGVSFIAVFIDVGGSDPTVTNSVKLITSDQTFPNGTLTEVASKTFDVSAADNGTQFDVMFDNPFTVDASTELIVAVDILDAPDPPNNYDFRIGANDAVENDPSYFSSVGCAIDNPTEFANVGPGFPNNHIILNLLGDENLSADEFSLAEVSIFPNPASEFINLDISSNINIKNVELFDALGKRSEVSIDDNKIDVSNKASGLYFLSIETNEGSLSKKVIIK